MARQSSLKPGEIATCLGRFVVNRGFNMVQWIMAKAKRRHPCTSPDSLARLAFYGWRFGSILLDGDPRRSSNVDASD